MSKMNMNDDFRDLRNDVFVTESLTDKSGKMLVANAMITPDYKNSDCIGKTFWCVGYVIRDVELEDGIHTGVILFDDEGTSYSTISAGVAKIVCAWRDAGLEPDWEEPMKVTYEQKSKGTFRFYTLKVDAKAKYEEG